LATPTTPENLFKHSMRPQGGQGGLSAAAKPAKVP